MRTTITTHGLVLLALTLALTVGCDGESVGDVDAGGDGIDAGPNSGSDAGPNADVDAGPVSDTDAGPVSDIDAGPVSDTDAGPNADVDAGPVSDVDAGPVATDGGPDGVMCGDTRCDPSTEQCCASATGPGGGRLDCRPLDEACEVATTCDGPEDCTGAMVCCIRFTGGGASGMCTAADACSGMAREACHEPGDCSNSGDMCCSRGSFGVCNATCGFGP